MLNMNLAQLNYLDSTNNTFVSKEMYILTKIIELKKISFLTIVSPIPRLKIPAKGASGRSLKPEDNQIGSAHPSNSEKWLNGDRRKSYSN